jgi:Fanconi anemia group M protein
MLALSGGLKMKLIIDSRENSTLCKLIERKANNMGVLNEKKWLEVGDYVIGNVCFEAKSAVDFMQSVLNKRIWTQVDNMDKWYDKNFVVIYGSMEDALSNMKYITNFNTDANPQQLRNTYKMRFKGAIGRLRLDYDINVIWRDRVEDVVDEIITIAKMAPIERKIINPSIPTRTATDDVRIDMLTTIKGVSETKAKALLKQHGCIMEIGDSNLNELTIVKGIGSTVADRINNVLNSQRRVKQ